MASPGDSSVPARLSRRLARRRAAAAGGAVKEEAGEADAGDEDDLPLIEVLEHFRLGKFFGDLEEAGVEAVEDLAYLQDADLEKFGMPMIPRRKLMDAVGGDWRDGGVGGAAALAASAAPAAAASAAAAPRAAAGLRGDAEGGDAGAGGLSEGSVIELRRLLSEIPERIEDFCSANGLDPGTRTSLAGLPPRVALRTMGLLGKGNAFLMQGVRKPGAALYARTRAAAAAEEAVASGAAAGVAGEPYEDWPRLLEGFAEANTLSPELRKTLQRLSREQALRVMGFTSGLRYVVEADRADVELEVASRINAALANEEMVPVVTRSACRPARLARYPSPQRPAGTASGGVVSGGRARSRSPIVRGGGGGGRGSRAAVVVGDLAPFWQRNLETFIQINELDERSARALGDMTKMQALHVMGLVGRENSFVIRGVRNTSATVMNRLQKAQEGNFDTEPYVHLPRLVEDFIEINRFDARGTEVLQTLRREVALHVMGFTAENAFVIAGVRNPSAALMARVSAAQRLYPPSG